MKAASALCLLSVLVGAGQTAPATVQDAAGQLKRRYQDLTARPIDCARLDDAWRVLIAMDVLAEQYPDDVPRATMLAGALASLQADASCDGWGRYTIRAEGGAISFHRASPLERRVPLTLPGGGVGIKREVPDLVLALSLMEPSRRDAFLGTLPLETRKAIGAWQAENAVLFEQLTLQTGKEAGPEEAALKAAFEILSRQDPKTPTTYEQFLSAVERKRVGGGPAASRER